MTVERIDAVTGEILPSLAECEETIARGVRGYVEAGEALRTIRDARLYRETHGTFEDYCRERCGWNDRRASQLIAAAEVSTTVGILGAPAPANEAQARELVGLPADEAAQIMRTAVETGQTVTARIIRETRVQITQPKETPKEAPMTAASRLAIPPPAYKPTDVTDWTPQGVDDLINADERELEAWKASTVPAPPKVVGLDGKTYTRPEPKTAEPRRAPLPPMVQSAGWDLTKSIERLQRLAADDRFNAHKKEVAPHLRSHLTSAIEACQDLLDRISN